MGDNGCLPEGDNVCLPKGDRLFPRGRPVVSQKGTEIVSRMVKKGVSQRETEVSTTLNNAVIGKASILGC